MSRMNDFNGSKRNGALCLKRRLWAAVESDNYECVKKALEDGAPVNSRNVEGITPVIYTMRNRNRNWARITGLLIHYGADMRGEYGKSKTKFVAQDILVQIESKEELEVIEQYACGTFAA